MYELYVSDLAHEDLNGIVGYIAEQLSSPKSASDFADEAELCYERLKQNPFQYSLCYDQRLADENYRRALIKNYILVYKVFEDEKRVVVYRFFYGRQDYARFL